jgi:hypothetical protein
MRPSVAGKSSPPRKLSKSFQNLPEVPGFYTHRAVRDRVLAKAIAGETKTQIAQEEGLSRPTVRKILNHPESSEFIEQQRRRLLCLSRDAVEVLRRKLVCEEDVDIATAVLVSMGVLSKDVFPPPLPRQTRLIVASSPTQYPK